jgi:FKBP-type peptidyl-prolyl cis-trans isomerase FklB
MHRFISLILIVSIAALALGQQPAAKQPGAAPLQLKTMDEQAAYALGLSFGRDALENGPELNADLIARGLLDAIRKAKPLLTAEQEQRAMDQFMAKKLGPGAEKNLKDGYEFLATNKTKPGVQTTESGLQYFVIKSGAGPSPKATDVVKVHYNGMLLDGKVFDTTTGKEPAEFPVNRVIQGWTEALQKMKAGDKWRLYVPSHLAYGPQGPHGGPIPPFATLIFDVELLEVVQ